MIIAKKTRKIRDAHIIFCASVAIIMIICNIKLMCFRWIP